MGDWSPEDMVFVRLGPADVPRLAALERECFSLPWGETEFAGAFSRKTFAAFGLRQKEFLAGYISFYHNIPELEILNIAVVPQCRGRGLGTRLLGTALQVAAKMGIERAVLEVRPGNTPALALYNAHNFVPAGRRRGYYADTGEDALICVCDLVAMRAKKE